MLRKKYLKTERMTFQVFKRNGADTRSTICKLFWSRWISAVDIGRYALSFYESLPRFLSRRKFTTFKSWIETRDHYLNWDQRSLFDQTDHILSIDIALTKTVNISRGWRSRASGNSSFVNSSNSTLEIDRYREIQNNS